MEFTTKSACIPQVVSSVDIYARVSEFHVVLVDYIVAYVQEVIVWHFCNSSSLPRQFSSHHLSLPLSTVFNSVTGACSSYCVRAQLAGLPGFASYANGSSLHLGAPNLHFSDAVVTDGIYM